MSTTDPLKLAKIHLGISDYSSPAQVPQEYLRELSNHLAICPDDTKFRISRQPNYGFGKVICLEAGCNQVEIVLERNPSLPDGGRSIGIGGLSAYRAHISQHPTHSRSRLARVKAEACGAGGSPYLTPLPKKGKLVKKGPISADRHLFREPHPPSSSPILSRPSIPPQTAGPSLQASQPARGTPDQHSSPSSSLGLRKRPSIFDLDLSSPITSGSVVPPEKRLKTASVSKTPLGTSTNTVAPPLPHPATSSNNGQGNNIDTDDVRTRINELQVEIFRKQDFLTRANRKSKKSTADLTRIRSYTKEIDSLRSLKDQLASRLPLMSPTTTRIGSTMTPAEPHRFPGPEAGPSRLPQIALDTKHEQSHTGPTVVPENSNPLDNMYARLFGHLVAPNSTDSLARRLQQNAVAGPSSQAQQPGHVLQNPVNSDDEEDDYGDIAMGYAGLRAGPYAPNFAPITVDDHRYDALGNFYGRGRDTFVGPVAKADDIEKFLVEAGNAESFDHNATVEKALEKLEIPSLFTMLPGMEVALMAHQVIGVAWMLEKEKSDLKGGCLADEMGLGKTVQMIALMMKNRSDDMFCKTTLIVAPTALLDQWRMEIEVKTNAGLKVLIYHGPSKPKKSKELLSYDVVITTFQTMALEWPDVEQEERKKKARAKKDDFIVHDSGDEDLKPKKKKEAGLLYQVDFYRVVLDEAQVVRNKKTRASRAITDLKCKYRWCLTGTPIINSLSDTYPYIRFLRLRPWYDFWEFHNRVGRLEKKQPELAIARLQAILATAMFRRKKDSKLDGKVLVELPPKDVALRRLVFTEEEREIYDAVEKKMQTQFNRFLRAGTVLKNYHHVLVLILRLRQCCSHPALIQEDAVAFVQADELDDAGKVLKRARELVSVEFVSKLKAKFKEAMLERMKAEKESADATVETDDCPICFDTFTNAVITSCGHSFCKECIHDVFNAPLVEPMNEDNQNQAKERACPACRTPITKDLLFDQAAFMPTDKELQEANGECDDSDIEMEDANPVKPKRRATGKSRNSKKSHGVGSDSEYEDDDEDDDDDLSDFIVQSDEDEEEKDARKALKKRLGKRKAQVILDSDEEISDDEEEVIFGRNPAAKLSSEAIKLLPRFLPSTKMKYMMEHIKQLFLERPNEKVLVISQWTSCLTLVSHYLQENNILHVKYQGDMNRSKREAAVRMFMAKDKARVMLMSLKCGGVGLNLTRANNVISMDLGWSQAIEDQAFDRVHRLGQVLPVQVERLVIENTVEDRMLKMQERKQMLADGSLGEGTAKKNGRMSVRELAELFGLDHRGRLLQQD
ncbi:SNF2 family N-terminal domain-containing protein [Lentinula raphanica]|nr:SNF2 family N-terminal domain-containing protein [Lentinula raphanica]